MPPPPLAATSGELSGAAPFRARCVPAALEVYAATLNSAQRDTSAELEPQLVMGLVGLLGQ